ncbi:MAG: CDP-alcohol phosphatidyltransferase family protein [Alphaproteobacteria bacterium]|nr:CDP-alcohol phosphatidyltransferase family protein [Alphaproteobacteria bacterium]
MKFFVNFLSAFRIFASFAIIPTLMFQMYWTSLILFVVAALSDFFDGYLARKYDVCTKIGGVMDHIGDKLLVVNTLIMLTVMMPVWFIVVPVIILVARELYVSGLREFLGTQKIEMPVPKARFSMGKVKTTFQMITAVAFLGLFALSTLVTPETISKNYLIAMNLLSQIGIIGLWISLLASVWSATQYTLTFADKLKKAKKK